ncbi:MAG: DUF1805 domain-containing protein [Candidatus Omnitrophica bacterium]|nr:DUF1805 domain-containing protein [Candidatus Omnitrophota bacterium]
MESKKVKLSNGMAMAYSVPCGPFNIIFATTGKGMVACGAFDVIALEKFNFPAVKLKKDGGIKTINGLLEAEASIVNKQALGYGVTAGMNGRAVLEKFL